MDHLFHMENPRHRPVRVPCLCSGEYDNGPFIDYPQRTGRPRTWPGGSIDHMLEDDHTERTREEEALFLQMWLFFGMLVGVLGEPVSSEHFIEVRDGNNQTRFITSRKLPEYLERWKERDSALSPDEKKTCIDTIQRTMNKALQTFDAAKSLFSENPILSPEVELSITVLAVTLEYAKIAIFGIDKEDVPLTRNWGVPEWIRSRMLQDGWCPSDISLLTAETSAPTMYYISSCLRPRMQGKHDETCSDQKCGASQIELANYRTKHFSCDCECEFLGPEKAKLHTIIENGQVPLIRIWEDETSHQLRLDVDPRTADSQYVAISHVWSDGLGNVDDNALPSCQLWRLYISLEILQIDQIKSNRPIYFWMDTLCVPRTNSAFRQHAIRCMSKIYKEADKVLVLDSYMQSTGHKNLVDCLLTIACSTWVRRLWTLQEGMLPGKFKVYFKFDNYQGRIACMDQSLLQGMYRWTSTTGRALLGPVETDSIGLFSLFLRRDFIDPKLIGMDGIEAMSDYLKESYISNTISFIWRKLRWRSTSDPEDETICFATLLDIEVAPLLQTAAENRMKSLVSRLSVFPAETVFYGGDRITDNVLGWVPKSLLGCAETISPIGPVGRITWFGIEVTYPGFVLHAKRTPLNGWFWMMNGDDRSCYRVVFDKISTVPVGTERHEKFKLFGLIIKDSLVEFISRRCCVIEIDDFMTALTWSSERVFYGKGMQVGTITPVDSVESQGARELWRAEMTEDRPDNLAVLGKPVDKDQKWCVR